MKDMLYLIKRIGETGWDYHSGFVVRADCEEDARRIANNKANPKSSYSTTDNDDDWRKAEVATCELIDGSGPAGIVLADFLNG